MGRSESGWPVGALVPGALLGCRPAHHGEAECGVKSLPDVTGSGRWGAELCVTSQRHPSLHPGPWSLGSYSGLSRCTEAVRGRAGSSERTLDCFTGAPRTHTLPRAPCWLLKTRGRFADSSCHHKRFIQFSSVAQSCPTLCNPMDCSTPGFPVHH